MAGEFGDRSLDQQEHDRRIGAAGELFEGRPSSARNNTTGEIQVPNKYVSQTFEILKKLDSYLPGFTQGNWQSTIRKYTRAHDDYANMNPWFGAETADLVYKDTNESFTRFLIEKDHLSDDKWEIATPTFFSK